ncbi:MAG: hypothetical protein WD649_06155 [Thermoleophilaceae bacterium]
MRKRRRNALVILLAAGCSALAAPTLAGSQPIHKSSLGPGDVVKHAPPYIPGRIYDITQGISKRPSENYNIRALEPGDVVKVARIPGKIYDITGGVSSGDVVKEAPLDPASVVKHVDSSPSSCGTSRFKVPDVLPNPEHGLDCDEAIEAVVDSGQSLGCKPGSYSEIGEDWAVESKDARCLWYQVVWGEDGRKYREFAFYVEYE